MEIKINKNQAEEIEGLTVEYPYVLHRAELGSTKIPWHWHEEVEFVYVRDGSMRLLTAGQERSFEKGEGFFINTNVLCSMENQDHCQIDSHLLNSTFLAGHFKSIFETKYLEPVLQNKKLDILELRGTNENQQKILAKLRTAARLQNEPDTEFQTRNLFSEIWLLLGKEIALLNYGERPVQTLRQERLVQMLAFIHHHYPNKLSLEEIAGAASVGKREALRCFQACMQKTPFEYLMEYRIEMSKKLLKDSEETVMEIAMATGFSSAAYYGKVFREACGMTPGAYRKESRRER